MKVEVSMDVEASAAEVEAVAEIFRREGFDGPISADVERRSLGEIPFVIYVSISVTAFLTAFAAAAGKDAYDNLKRFIRDIRSARDGHDGSIVVEDREDHQDSTVLVLSADLPDEAFEALRALDLEAMKGAYLVWDRDGDKGWYDPMAR
ncbi:MAG TPA: hypothetical protein VLI94_12075 [Solirubrobacterales bacterium]|nr:hypothetical protein [Solirubrobacterales bacterium]